MIKLQKSNKLGVGIIITESKNIIDIQPESKNRKNFSSTSEINRITHNIIDSDSSTPLQSVYIHKIILENFLSFEHDEVIFDHEFSIITGPNGAGKSSIYQALKFVLGSNDYDGRYSKWANFIKSGQDYTRIQLFLVVNSEEYIIQRSVHLDKSPKFSIKTPNDEKLHPTNGQTIENFVRSIDIDPNNVFSFLSQGNIDSIKDFKEETLCSFVEQGLGINILREEILKQKEKIEELKKEYSALNSRNDNLKFQLSDLTPKLQRYEKKKKLIEQLEHLKEELMWAQKSEIVAEIEQINKNIEEKQTQIDNINERKNQIIRKIVEHETTLKEFQLMLNANRESYARKDSRIQSIVNDLNAMTEEKNRIAEVIELCDEKIRIKQSEKKKFEVQFQTHSLKIKEIEIQLAIQHENNSQLQTEQQQLILEIQKYQEILLSYETTKNQLLFAQQEEKNLSDTHSQIENDIKIKIKEIEQLLHELNQSSWFMKNPEPDLHQRMKKLFTQYQITIAESNQKVVDLNKQYEIIVKNIEQIKKSVLHQSLPKPTEIQATIDEIRERKINCIGPLIDYITYDDLFQTAIESVFGFRVLYSFIAKSNEDFSLLKSIVQRNRAFCNIYLEKSKKLEILPSLKMDINSGVFGYLAEKITPTISDESILKVIHSIAGKTLIVKDHITGTNFIQKFDYTSYVVTLDGEQIRPKKFVIEARPMIAEKNKEKFSSVAEAKLRLNTLYEQSTDNRNKVNNVNSQLEENKRKVEILEKRLSQVEHLNSKFKMMEFHSNKKNLLIQNREKIFVQTKQHIQKIESIQQDLAEIQLKLPQNILTIQQRVSKLPEFLKEGQEKYDNLLEVKNHLSNESNQAHLQLNSLETEISYITQERQEKKDELQKKDGTFFSLFQENQQLRKEIEELKKEKEGLDHKIDDIGKLIYESKEQDSNIDSNLIEVKTQINLLNNQFNEKQKQLDEIYLITSKFNSAYLENRPIDMIQIDIAMIEKYISNYSDVSENILIEKERIEETIFQIKEKQTIIEEEIKAAKEAEESLESSYYQRYETSIVILENAINEQLNYAQMNFIIEIKLKGKIDTLGLEIKANMHSIDSSIMYPLSALSGGQRSMVGICMMLSLNQLKPTPLNVYDECDMFLDEKNAQTVAKLIFNLAQTGIQFIILMPSKNKALLQLANKVVGVSRNGKQGPSTIHYSQPIHVK